MGKKIRKLFVTVCLSVFLGSLIGFAFADMPEKESHYPAAPFGNSLLQMGITYAAVHDEIAEISQETMELIATMRYQKALSFAKRGLELSEKLIGPDRKMSIVLFLNLMANSYIHLESYDLAQPIIARALKESYAIQPPNAPTIILSLRNQATLYASLGDYQSALSTQKKVLHMIQKMLGANSRSAATCLYDMSTVYMNMRDYDQARQLTEQSLKLYMNDKREDGDTAACLNRLGDIFFIQGKYYESLRYLKDALRISEKVQKDHPDTAQYLLDLGTLYHGIGDDASSVTYYENSLRIYEKVLGVEHPWTLANRALVGQCYLKLKDYSKAETFIKKSKDPFALSALNMAKGDYIEALKNLDARRSNTVPTEEMMAQQIYYMMKGQALAGLGRRSEAADFFLKVVRELEDRRFRIERKGPCPTGEMCTTCPYKYLTAVLGEASQHGETLSAAFRTYGDSPSEAGFYFAEATKARRLLEEMSARAGENIQAEIPWDLKHREHNLLSQLSSLNGQKEIALRGGRKENLEKINIRKEMLSRELNDLIEKLYRSSPIYATLRYPRPVLAKNIPLNSHEIILEYALGAEQCYLFVVRKGGVEKVISIPLGENLLAQKIATFMAPMLDSNNQGKNFSTAKAKELYDILLYSALSTVKETDQVLIIPDGILGLLPFEMLIISENSGIGEPLYVFDRYTTRYYQSAAMLALQRTLKREKAPKPFFGIGNPVFSDSAHTTRRTVIKSHTSFPKHDTRRDEEVQVVLPLPDTEEEVRTIAELMGVKAVPPDILLGADASESRLMQVPLMDYRYIHFATHANVGSIGAMCEPYICLGVEGTQDGKEGFFTMSKVLRLHLRADMVVLSACVTGRGKLMEGEGVMNLARAFQYAGARSVVVSLWEVAIGRTTIDYMTHFYQHLITGKDRAEALRLTSVAFLKFIDIMQPTVCPCTSN